MQSPFPGMDPYLEQHWGDVHHRLVQYACDQLQDRLPENLRARVEERVVVELPPPDDQSYYPDVRIVEHRRPGSSPAAVATAESTMAVPIEVPFVEPETQGYVEIRELHPDRRLVTVIEVLSLSNKYAGMGRDLYRQKQCDLHWSNKSLVEIDLLRAGPHALQLSLARYPQAALTPYKVCVHRAGKAKHEFYPVPLRQTLPTIRIPLRETDADVPLDLQALVTQVYRNGRYDDIDYTVPPVPPLDSDDEAWADELLRAAGKRAGAASK